MNRTTKQFALAASIALGAASAGLQADIKLEPGAGNGVVITNIDAQPGFDKPVCYDSGASGTTGELGNCVTPLNGISCWDLNQDGIKDVAEDFNKDRIVDVLDCRPAEVYQGEPKDRTWYVSSHALLRTQVPSDKTDTNYLEIYPALTLPFGDCAPADTSKDQSDCLTDPIKDPCGLWEWGVSGDQWSVRAKQGYNYATYNYLSWDGGQYFGWADCRDACLGDPQCVGASIEEAEGISEGMVCKLVAKTPAPDYSFRHAFVNTKPAVAYGWGDRDESPQSGAIGAVLSVCEAPAP